MEIRVVRPEEWPSLRATRLAALGDAPTAYASTLPDALAHPDEVWIRRATPSDDEASLAAIDAGTWVGMCAVLVDRIANRAQLVAMWVDPGHRRRGIGVGLIAAATAWCRSRGVATIHLWVNEANAAAIALYRHAGFEPSGERIPLESHAGHFEVSMSRSMDESRYPDTLAPWSPVPADIGLIGLAVMGQNLALNLADHGHRVVVHNRTPDRTREFLSGPAAGTGIVGADTLAELVAALSVPRRILLMVKAGGPVDGVLEELTPLLSAGDVVIDGGNSHHLDTARRVRDLGSRGIRFVGAGISGGEEGARRGPSIMPGGDREAWPLVSGLLQSIAAKVEDGTPCCDWVGPGGAGHFVKMVHNGIEYGDIQLLAEAYHVMHAGLAMTHDEIADVFAEWNRGRLESYLVEIAAAVVRRREDGAPLLDRILDAAGQKGTGRWTVESALLMGQPLTLAAEAVFARAVSALADERARAAAVLAGPTLMAVPDRAAAIADLEQALYASKIVSYAQGFMLLRAASAEYDWDLDHGSIALMWRQGCIIRAAFLERIRDAFAGDPQLPNLLLDPGFAATVAAAQPGWRRTIAGAVTAGIPVPAHGSALAFFDSYRNARLPANLIQGLRDYFGAHGYERTDRPRGEYFHTDWTGHGGDVGAGTYNA